MRPEQPLKSIDDIYDKWKTLRELEVLHRRINDIIVPATTEDLTETAATDLSEALVAVDVDTAAEVATVVNATNTRVNEIYALLVSTNAAINSILDKIRLSS